MPSPKPRPVNHADMAVRARVAQDAALHRIPDRLCTESDSPFRCDAIANEIRISIDGVEMVGCVAEYCISGGWARVYRHGPDGKNIPNVLKTGWSIKRMHGRIIVWWKSDAVPDGAIVPKSEATPNA